MYFPLPIHFPRIETDIYHSHVPSPNLAYFVKDASPHIVTYHNDVVLPRKINGWGIPWSFSAPIEQANKKLLRPVLEEADIIIATTKSYAKTSLMLKDYLHKVKVMLNAVEPSVYKPGCERSPYVAYMGRTVDYKGIGTLLETMGYVQRTEEIDLVMGMGTISATMRLRQDPSESRPISLAGWTGTA